jgi:hypothetical protein
VEYESIAEGAENCNNETAEGAENAEDSGTTEWQKLSFFFLSLLLLKEID